MARSRKRKSLSQHVMSLATFGMPRVVKNIVGNRLIAPLAITAMLTLAMSGVVSIDWQNGRPHFQFNKERVAEIEQAAQQTKSKLEELTSSQGNSSTETTPVAKTRNTLAPAGSSFARTPIASNTIRIASFNIQVFGTSKASKPNVMEILAQVVRKFDLVAIQELRTTDETVMQSFLSRINATGRAYNYVVGPRLGRTNSKEQYVFVFDTQRIEIDSSSLTTLPDPQDLLHREPLAARFRTKVTPETNAFTFILVNIHTDPDETKTELDALGDLYPLVQQKNPWAEDDVILLGDLNVNNKRLGKLGALPDITYTVHGGPTNTRQTKSYDNIVFSRTPTTEFTGQSGIVNLQQEFQLSQEQALKVSDHYPIWAEFTVTEGGGTVLATRTELPTTRTTGPAGDNLAAYGNPKVPSPDNERQGSMVSHNGPGITSPNHYPSTTTYTRAQPAPSPNYHTPSGYSTPPGINETTQGTSGQPHASTVSAGPGQPTYLPARYPQQKYAPQTNDPQQISAPEVDLTNQPAYPGATGYQPTTGNTPAAYDQSPPNIRGRRFFRRN